MNLATTRAAQRCGDTPTSQMTISGQEIRLGTVIERVRDLGTTTIRTIIGAVTASRIRCQVMVGEFGMPLSSTKADTTGTFLVLAHGYGTSKLRPVSELGEVDSSLHVYEEVL